MTCAICIGVYWCDTLYNRDWIYSVRVCVPHSTVLLMLSSALVCLGQEDLQMATEGADSVLVSVTCDGHVSVT